MESIAKRRIMKRNVKTTNFVYVALSEKGQSMENGVVGHNVRANVVRKMPLKLARGNVCKIDPIVAKSMGKKSWRIKCPAPFPVKVTEKILMEFFKAFSSIFSPFSLQEDLKWLEWEQWSQCSATCGRGTRKRKRHCQAGNSESQECPKSTEEQVEDCQEAKCHGIMPITFLNFSIHQQDP